MGSLAERTRGKAAAGGPSEAADCGARCAKLQLASEAAAGGPGEDQVKQQLVDWVVPHSCADKPGGTTGEQDRLYNPGFQYREIKPQTSEKTCGGCGGGINSQPRGRVCWRDPQGPRVCTSPSTQESAPEGPNLLVGREVIESWSRAQQAALFLFRPLLHV